MDPLTIYAIIAIGAAALAVVMMVLGLDDLELDMDFEVDPNGGSNGPGPFSPIVLAAFFAGFGMTGALLSYGTALAQVPIIFISIVGGLPVHLGIWLGLRKFFGKTVGQVTEHGLVGLTGTVISTIQSGQRGEVILDTSTGRRTYPATATNKKEVGTMVTVSRDLGAYVMVE